MFWEELLKLQHVADEEIFREKCYSNMFAIRSGEGVRDAHV